MSKVTFLEKFFLKPNEQTMRKEEVKFEGGLTFQSKKVKGNLILTDERIVFIANKHELGNLEKVIFNISLDRILLGETEKSRMGTIFGKIGLSSLSKHFLIFSYEDLFGVMQKPKFRSLNPMEWSNTLKILASKKIRSSLPVYEIRKKIEEFNDFITFLSVEKFIRPIYYDPVSRVIQISNEQLYIDKDWVYDGSSELTKNLEEWIISFKERNSDTKWLMHQK